MLRRSPKKAEGGPVPDASVQEPRKTVSGRDLFRSKSSKSMKSTSTAVRLISKSLGGKPSQVAASKPSDVALVDSNFFTTAISVVVFANVVCIGLETEMDGGAPATFAFINNSFLLIYLVEIFFRLITHGVKVFREFLTVLDVLLVFAAFIERMASSSVMGRSLPTLRLGRFFRVLRSTKALKLSRELWVMVASARTAAWTIVWMSVALFLLLWIVGGFATDAVGGSSEWAASLNPSLDNTFVPFRPFDIREHFGSISRSFLTLFQVVTLSQWTDIARPLINVYPVLAVFFLAFLCTTTYGLLVSVIANLVVDSMIHSKQNEKAVIDNKREQRRKAGQYAMVMLQVADRDGDGELNVDELQYALDELGLEQVLVDLGVPVTSPEELIRMFDRNGDQQVSYAELVEGAILMDEEITHRDFVKLALWLQNLMNRVACLEERMGRLADIVRLQRTKLQAAFEALSRTMHTADETILRQRALKVIRDQQLPEPSIQAPPSAFVPRSQESIQSEAEEFLNFARRFLGDSIPNLPDMPEITTAPEGSPAQLALDDSLPGSVESPSKTRNPSLAVLDKLRGAGRAPGHGFLPAAPPQEHLWREQTRIDRTNGQFDDKYAAYFGQPSASTLHVRDTINRHRN